MTKKTQDKESRLGHDPLEWLQDDIANLTNEVSEQESTDDTPAESDLSLPQDSANAEQDNESTHTTPTFDNELIPGFKLSKTDGTLILPARLTVHVAETLHQDWLQILDIADMYALQIDAEKLTELDAAGLQLLVAFSRSLQAQSTKVTLINVSENIATVFQLTGLETWFQPLMEAA